MKSLNIRKKLVTLAVASVVSGGAMMAMTAPAHAMNVSQNNVGQVLLFPYYTVKNGFDTVFTVTNTTNKTAIFKVRFREALNSREVRDFNVILSPHDHWAGAITATTAGGAMFRTFDKSCTSPRLPGMQANADRAAAGSKGEIDFTNALYSAPYNDGAEQTMARTQEGYFEVILMGVSDRDPATAANTLEYNAKHVSGVPRDCTTVDNMFLDTFTNFAYMDAPENILKGHVTYINVANGKAIDAEPTAIENFQTTQNIVNPPGDSVPDLRDGDAVSTINFLDNGVAMTSVVAGSEDAVTNLLQAASVVNEYATGAGASTSWVVTFPTKHHYTDAYTSAGTTTTGTASAPFSEWFSGGTTGKSCDNISMSLYNREEGTVVSVDNTQFSPFNPSSPTVSLCYEANVVDFNSSSVFGSGTNRLAVDTSAVGSAGWAQLNFTEAPAATTGLNGYLGLPVIGFSAIVRDTLEGATKNYGSATEHSFVRGYVGNP